MRSNSRALLFGLAVGLATAGCAKTLGQDDCARFRDRLRAWGDNKQKAKADQKAIDTFMQSCVGSTVSRWTVRCLERANDEVTFFRCLD